MQDLTGTDTTASHYQETTILPTDLLVSSAPASTPLVQTGPLPHDWSTNTQQNRHNQEHLEFHYDEGEFVGNDKDEQVGPSGSVPNVSLDDMLGSASEFVKKLYRMLEDPRFQAIVCWGPLGDCFIVKDIQECTKFVLPRLFKHSNFSSFVRQLNKYGFRKIKTAESDEKGEHSWVFQHPDFHASHPEAFQNIKRKPSTSQKSARELAIAFPADASPSSSSSPSTANNSNRRRRLSAPQTRFASDVRLTASISENLKDRITTLERNQEGIFRELVDFQRELEARNDIIQRLIVLSLRNRRDNTVNTTQNGSLSNPGSNIDHQQYPSTFPPSDLQLDLQQDLKSNTIQDPELSYVSSNNNTFRLIQPSFDQGNFASFFGQQPPSPATSSNIGSHRSHRRYSVNDARGSRGHSYGLGSYTSSFSGDPQAEVNNDDHPSL